MTYTNEAAIIGSGTASPAAIQAWFVSLGESYKRYAPDDQYKSPPADLGAAIVAECQRYAVNHDLAAAQVLHETAAWQSKYARERNNPGGIGAINSDPDQAIHFPSVAAGMRAHVAHLLTYAKGDGPWTADTPRYANVKAKGWVGKAPRWVDLNGKWAWPGQTYGESIVTLANRLLAFAATYEEESSVPEQSELIDIRHRLQTATQGNRGPLRTIPMSRKRGVVIHYRGVVTTPAPGYDSFAADATYHVNKDWGQGSRGDGIMYHVGIGWDAKAYKLRDENRVLWHCGVTKYNEEALAIQLPMGGNQRATPAMLATLTRVVDEWRKATGTLRSEVWGHGELSSTSCPGTLLDDFVRPYRAGSDEPAQPDALYIEGNPFGNVPIVAGFRALFLETGKAKYPNDPIAGGLSVWGYPENPEYPVSDGSAQVFERAIMRYHKGAQPPWDVVMALRHEQIPERAA